jgi:hypothetical protein
MVGGDYVFSKILIVNEVCIAYGQVNLQLGIDRSEINQIFGVDLLIVRNQGNEVTDHRRRKRNFR